MNNIDLDIDVKSPAEVDNFTEGFFHLVMQDFKH